MCKISLFRTLELVIDITLLMTLSEVYTRSSAGWPRSRVQKPIRMLRREVMCSLLSAVSLHFVPPFLLTFIKQWILLTERLPCPFCRNDRRSTCLLEARVETTEKTNAHHITTVTDTLNILFLRMLDC